jgi:TetR/AcrR family transcriptional repressor of nem operon
MKESGLTHGGFYKHFPSRDDLLVEAIEESIREMGGKLIAAANDAPREEAWKVIVKSYLSAEHCKNPDTGCPMAALGPEIARTGPKVKKRIASAVRTYQELLVQYMPGKNDSDKDRNFIAIFSAMIGAMSIARTMSDASRQRVILDAVQSHLFRSF